MVNNISLDELTTIPSTSDAPPTAAPATTTSSAPATTTSSAPATTTSSAPATTQSTSASSAPASSTTSSESKWAPKINPDGSISPVIVPEGTIPWDNYYD